MKILKTILIVIVVIIAIPLVTALFVKNDYGVQREIVINRPVPDVFNYIKLLKNQEYYNKWWQMDPTTKKTFTGTDGTVGFVAAWESSGSHAGQGEQEITAITDGHRLDSELRFIKPFEGKANASMSTEAAGDNQTKVTWSFKGRNNYPMNFMNLFTNKMLGGDLQTSLENLKGVLEK